jgi:hypothetical protein
LELGFKLGDSGVAQCDVFLKAETLMHLQRVFSRGCRFEVVEAHTPPVMTSVMDRITEDGAVETMVDDEHKPVEELVSTPPRNPSIPQPVLAAVPYPAALVVDR